MILLKMNEETKEALSKLWQDKNFKLLIKLLKTRIDNLGKGVLVARDASLIAEYQMEAQVITRLIKTMKDAALKVETRKKEKESKKT